MTEDQDWRESSPVFKLLIERWIEHGAGRLVPSCLIVDEFTRFANDKNLARRIPQFENWLLVFDEIVNWFSSLALALKREFLTGEHNSIHLNVMTPLATKFSADLCAIRSLMLAGFEVQARILARSAVETVELMFIVPYERDIERAFFEANDFKKTNEFWYTHIRKGRLRKRANKLTESVLQLPPDTWKKFREDTKRCNQRSLIHLQSWAYYQCSLTRNMRTGRGIGELGPMLPL